MMMIQHFLCWPRHRQPSKVPWRMVLERLSWRVTYPNYAHFRLLTVATLRCTSTQIWTQSGCFGSRCTRWPVTHFVYSLFLSPGYCKKWSLKIGSLKKNWKRKICSICGVVTNYVSEIIFFISVWCRHCGSKQCFRTLKVYHPLELQARVYCCDGERDGRVRSKQILR